MNTYRTSEHMARLLMNDKSADIYCYILYLITAFPKTNLRDLDAAQAKIIRLWLDKSVLEMSLDMQVRGISPEELTDFCVNTQIIVDRPIQEIIHTGHILYEKSQG